MAHGDLEGPFFTSTNNILGSDDPRYFSKAAQDTESTAFGQFLVCGVTVRTMTIGRHSKFPKLHMMETISDHNSVFAHSIRFEDSS
jgi:hypothetical protein